MSTIIFLGCVVLAIGALLGLDWFMAGLKSRRLLTSARDGEIGNAAVGYAEIERLGTDIGRKTDYSP